MKISWNTLDWIYSNKLPLTSITAARRLRNFLLAFPTVSLSKLVTAAIILAFSVSLVLRGVLLVSFSIIPHTSRGLLSWELGGQMLKLISSQKFFHAQHQVLLLVLHSTESVARRKVFQLPLSHPSQHKFVLAFDIGLGVESEAMWEDEWRHNITITLDHSKYCDVNWVFGFH